MTPQSTFFVLAPIRSDREADLRALLASMNEAPGRVNASNALVPFAKFGTLHVARLLIVDDQSTKDGSAYGLPDPNYPLYLAFLGDVDGDGRAFLGELARGAGDGLRTLFSCCEGFSPGSDLLSWMNAHNINSSATYVNQPGRTVRRVREDAALREALEAHLRNPSAGLEQMSPPALHRALRRLVDEDVAAGKLKLSGEEPTPFGWWLRNALHLIGVPIVLILLSPLLLIAGLIGVIELRRLEKSDPELCWRTDPAWAAGLAVIEDHDVSNQFSAMGSLKPGRVRLWTTRLVLLAIDYAARHVYKHGRLARVRTIHFARWVFLDNRRRIIFISNYDGSLESYMDDFINKVGFGLNVVFCNGIGYPSTDWLIARGCRDERKFKEYLRRHQLPTNVWYKAYPGLTAIDLERNMRIRKGFEDGSMSDQDAQAWAALL
jgi:hypothetical protein